MQKNLVYIRLVCLFMVLLMTLSPATAITGESQGSGPYYRSGYSYSSGPKHGNPGQGIHHVKCYGNSIRGVCFSLP